MAESDNCLVRESGVATGGSIPRRSNYGETDSNKTTTGEKPESVFRAGAAKVLKEADGNQEGAASEQDLREQFGVAQQPQGLDAVVAESAIHYKTTAVSAGRRPITGPFSRGARVRAGFVEFIAYG